MSVTSARDDVTIRRVRPEDGPVLRGLRIAALRDAPDAFGEPIVEAEQRSDDEWRAMARQSSAGDSRAWFVAESGEGDDARPIGLALGRRRPPDTCMLFSMWVAPDARRFGVGRRLVHAVEAWAATWGAREVVLWVTLANAAALPFYAALGYAVDHGGPDAESGREHGAVALRRSIAAT